MTPLEILTTDLVRALDRLLLGAVCRQPSSVNMYRPCSEEQALHLLVAWLEAMDAPIAPVVRAGVFVEQGRSLSKIRRSIQPPYLAAPLGASDAYWGGHDARSIITTACTLYALVVVEQSVSTETVQAAAHLLTFPVGLFDSASSTEAAKDTWHELGAYVAAVLDANRRADAFVAGAAIAFDVLAWAETHRCRNVLVDEMARVRRDADDKETFHRACFTQQVAGTPDLHR